VAEVRGGSISSKILDIPFEFVSKVASTSAVAKASDVESSSTAARHDRNWWMLE
jgi:hypothetical protein